MRVDAAKYKNHETAQFGNLFLAVPLVKIKYNDFSERTVLLQDFLTKTKKKVI